MSNVAKFPTKINLFYSYSTTSLAYITVSATKTRLGITDAKLLVVTTAMGLYTANWAKYIDPNQSTTIVKKTNKSMIATLKTNFNSIYGDILDGTLTVSDRDTLLLFVRAVGNPISAVNYSPVMSINAVAYLLLKLLFVNSATPDSKAMPKGNKIFMEYYIGAAGLTAGNIPFANGTNVTRAFYTILFPDTTIGLTIYIRAYYENTRGARGPVSVTLTKVIS